MAAELPPPPGSPERPPRVKMPGEQARVLRTIDGLALEARARLPRTATRAVVLCHPHPLYGGTMDNAVIVSVARLLRERGQDAVGTLRFNFRGVPQSEGQHDEGRGEVLDVAAAIDAVRRDLPEASVMLAGYSFGSSMVLRAAVEDRSIERLVLIAPATSLFEHAVTRPQGPSAIGVIVGDSDPLVSVDEAQALAARLNASFRVIAGANHLFVGQRRAVAEAAVGMLLGD